MEQKCFACKSIQKNLIERCKFIVRDNFIRIEMCKAILFSNSSIQFTMKMRGDFLLKHALTKFDCSS
jgi:hypothetical protein